MIVFISGPYGVGKSTVAEALAPRLNALIFDAEAVGNAVRDSELKSKYEREMY